MINQIGYKSMTTHRWAYIFSMWMLATGCGEDLGQGWGDSQEDNSQDSTINQSSTTIVQAQPKVESKRIKIPITLASSANSAGFSLISSATAYNLSLENCASSYGASVTESNLDGVEVYNHDPNCLAKLTQFTVGGITYVPTSTAPFTTWNTGDTAIFDEIGEPGTAPMRVIVISTLSNPTTATDTINFGYSEVSRGNDRAILWTTIGSNASITVASVAPPAYTIRSIELLDLSSTGAGQFQFVLECTSSIGITNSCDSTLLSDIDYKLVADTFGGSLTQAQADTVFSTVGTFVTLPDQRVSPGDLLTANGGFQSISTDGPDLMASNPNMILILRSISTSYQYFNIDVTVSVSY